MNENEPVSPAKAVLLVGKGVFIEALRKKDVYVLLMLMLVFMLGVQAVNMVGIENPATGTFLLNLGMSLAYYCAHVLTLALSARQIPDEIESRTVYPLLATPLKRRFVVVGKWCASTLCGFCVFIILLALGWVCVPKMETYSSGMLGQLVLLQFVSLGLLSASAITLSLFLPRGLNITLVGLWFLMGTRLLDLQTRLWEENAVGWVARVFAYYLPDFSKLNLITLYTDGVAALNAWVVLNLFSYAAVFLSFFLFLGVVRFEKQQL